jgi:hypothetical protein
MIIYDHWVHKIQGAIPMGKYDSLSSTLSSNDKTMRCVLKGTQQRNGRENIKREYQKSMTTS